MTKTDLLFNPGLVVPPRTDGSEITGVKIFPVALLVTIASKERLLSRAAAKQ